MSSKNPFIEVRKTEDYQKHKKESDAKIKLAKTIYKARKKQGMSQKELAEKVEITQSMVSDIEAASYNPGYILLVNIFSALDLDGLDVANLFDLKIPLTVKDCLLEHKEAVYKKNNNIKDNEKYNIITY